MSKIIVTLSGSVGDQGLLPEDIDGIKEDCEDVLRGLDVHGVDVEVEVVQ